MVPALWLIGSCTDLAGWTVRSADNMAFHVFYASLLTLWIALLFGGPLLRLRLRQVSHHVRLKAQWLVPQGRAPDDT